MLYIEPASGYTASFHDANEGLPCDKASHFYLANWGEENFGGAKLPIEASLVGADHSERPCKHNSAQCAV